MQMNRIDYYQILEVSRDASNDEIKQAFRRLARRYHPDVSDDPDAEERFKVLSEAYEVLGHQDRRVAYDSSVAYGHKRNGDVSGADWSPRGRRPAFDFEAGAEWTTVSASAQMNGQPQRSGQANAGMQAEHHFDRVGTQDLETSVIVSVEEICQGTERTLEVAGRGSIRVAIPAGVLPGQTLRLTGLGPPGPTGRAGDLCVHIHVSPHDLYRIKGKTIVLDMPVTPWEAALGVSLKIPTPYGRVRVKVPPGTVSGQSLRLRGRGLPAADGSGDLFVQLKIVLPPEMSETELNLYRRLGEISGFDPRAHFPQS